jgi:hypothetical protein
LELSGKVILAETANRYYFNCNAAYFINDSAVMTKNPGMLLNSIARVIFYSKTFPQKLFYIYA